MIIETFKINKEPRITEHNGSTIFALGFGKKRVVKGQDEWTNFSADIWCKSDAQINFYKTALVVGSVVSVSAEKVYIRSYVNNSNETINMIALEFPRILEVITQQGAPAQQAPVQNEQHSAGAKPLEDDLPF